MDAQGRHVSCGRCGGLGAVHPIDGEYVAWKLEDSLGRLSAQFAGETFTPTPEPEEPMERCGICGGAGVLSEARWSRLNAPDRYEREDIEVLLMQIASRMRDEGGE